jgi:type IV secretion system protein VirB6
MKAWYSDNNGGYNVDISWGGCPKYNGENVQYAVAKSSSLLTEGMWRSVPKNAYLKGNDIVINESGTLFFRIATLPAPAGANAQVTEMYTNPGNYFGQYYIVAEQLGPAGKKITSGPIGDLVRTIKETVIGSKTERGAAKKIFDSITQNPQYIGTVRALLVLYIAFFAVSFIMGIIKFNQEEAIIRLVKVGVIVALISPTAWDFFGEYLLNMFIEGGIQLIAIMVAGSFSTAIVDVSDDPFAVFDLFDGPFLQLTSKAVWLKVYGLVCTGLLGIVVAIVIVYAILMYVLSLFKATLVYIYSLIGIAILILSAPVFITCMLFQTTKQMFDNWWKNLISFTLQPVLVFASIAIFNLVIMTLLYSTLNFTVCQYCILGIDLGDLYNECWIPGYQTTLGRHGPEDVPNFFMPGSTVSAALAFALTANAMETFSTFAAKVANVLISGSFIREATAAAPAEDTFNTAKGTLTTTAQNIPQMGKMGMGMLDGAKGVMRGGGGAGGGGS